MKKMIVSMFVLGMCLIVSPQALAAIDEGLVAWWPFAGNANDESGNGNHGTVDGATLTKDRFGNIDSAYEFDGTDDFIDIGDKLDMGTSDFTLAVWIKGDPGMQEWGRIIDKGYATAYALGRRSSTGKVGFEYLNSGSQGNSFSTVSDIVDNTWHFVVVVKIGNIATIYADGVEENSETVSTASQDNNRSLLIGYNPGEGSPLGHWKGVIDDIRIYTRGLSEEEILELYGERGDCNGEVVTIWGTEDHDIIRGTVGADVIHGLGGNDTIFGREGDDVICGGDGNDTVFGRIGNDIILGGDGHDVLQGEAGDDMLIGGPGNDTISGDAGNDMLYGNEGNDTLIGGSGIDELYGSILWAEDNDSCYDQQVQVFDGVFEGCEAIYLEGPFDLIPSTPHSAF